METKCWEAVDVAAAVAVGTMDYHRCHHGTGSTETKYSEASSAAAGTTSYYRYHRGTFPDAGLMETRYSGASSAGAAAAACWFDRAHTARDKDKEASG